MSDKLITSTFMILSAIVGVAIIAVLVSKSANTPAVIKAGASGFSSILSSALSPITGQTGNSGSPTMQFI